MDISPAALALSSADPRLDSLRESLLRAMQREPQCRREGSRVTTEVLGALRYVLEPETCNAYLEFRTAKGAWRRAGIDWVLDAPLESVSWIDAYLQHTAGPGPYGDSVAKQRAHRLALTARLRAEARTSGLTHELQRRIKAAIPLDPDVRWMIDRLLPGGEWDVPATSRDYSDVWRSRALWSDLRNDNEDLAMLLRLLHRASDADSPKAAVDFAGLKAHFLALNTGGAGWRLICRHARTLCAHALAAGNGKDLDVLIALQARLLRGFDGALPHPELVRAILRSTHLVERLDELDIPHRLLELADAAHAQARQEASAESFIEDEWLPVLAWLIEARPFFHRNQWARGWPAILRAKSDWTLQELALASHGEWPALAAPIALGPLEAVELDSAARLVVEGIEMAHCVADYAEECMAGRSRIFSLRRRDTGKRIATVLCQSTPRSWQVWQSRGRANSTLPDDVADAVKGIPTHLQADLHKDNDEIAELLASLEDE